MVQSYTYIITAAVILLVAGVAAVNHLQTVSNFDYIAKKNALESAASYIVAGIWNAVEEVKLVRYSGVERKFVSVGFPVYAEIRQAAGGWELVVQAMGVEVVRRLPALENVEYTPSFSGGDYVIVAAVVDAERIVVRLESEL